MANPEKSRGIPHRLKQLAASAGAVAVVGGGIGYIVNWTAEYSAHTENRVQTLENDFGGSYNLVDLRTVPGFEFNGSVGGFIIFSGQIDGKTESMLQFAWKTKGNPQETIISEVPMSEVIFVVSPDDAAGKYKGPTLTFALDGNKVYPDANTNPIDEANPNTIVDKYLKLATISMSQQDFDSFRGTAAPTK